MSDYLIKGETLTSIANAIRGKKGSTSPIKTQDFATEIEGIQIGGGGGDIDGLIDGTLTVVTSNVTSIRERAFSNYSTLLTANFPKVTSIKDYAFNSCKALTTVNIPNATRIGYMAFRDCQKLTTVEFPNATSLGDYTFMGCSALTTANLPNVTSLGVYEFNSCKALTTANFPNATSIGTYAFNFCTSLTTANFPNATSIGSSAFSSCRALTTANFPNATSIESYAFENNYLLTKLIIGTDSTITPTLSNTNAFQNCYHILGIKNANYNPNGDKDGYIYVPNSLVASYRTATNWVTYATQIMPWVATREELDSIDNTLYDHACVGENGAEYIYTGSRWTIFR